MGDQQDVVTASKERSAGVPGAPGPFAKDTAALERGRRSFRASFGRHVEDVGPPDEGGGSAACERWQPAVAPGVQRGRELS